MKIVTGGSNAIQNCQDPWFNAFVKPEGRMEYVSQNKCYCLMISVTSYCAGSCAYCFASSDKNATTILSKEIVFSLIDTAEKMEVKEIALTGGDALAHPHWPDMILYAKEKGFNQGLGTSWLISKKVAKKIVELDVGFVCGHIDSIDPDAYSRVHTDPKTLELKKKGLFNLLEAGFPKERVMVLVTVTRPVLETLEKTMDWYIDEIGLSQVGLMALKGVGFGNRHREWEPSLSEYKRVHEYRAKRMGEHWLHIGPSDIGKPFCKTHFIVHEDGNVAPCNTMRGAAVGNIFEEDLLEIYEKHRNFLLKNYELKGACNNCENNDVCFGCRANALFYAGDVNSSDPKCWWNPENEDIYYKEAKETRG